MKKYDYIIIGAGITGITLCKLLRQKGYSVCVLEKNNHVGGLCCTKNINGHILDIGGGHFFHTKHQKIFDYIFSYLPESEFNYFERISKIEINNQDIDYPVESNIWQLDTESCIDYLISIIRNGESQGYNQPHNYEEWIRWKLGDKICDNYMLPYNNKLWGVSPSEMDIDWLYKIPRVDVNEVLRYCIEHKQDKNKFPAHINFYYPKQGGFQRIVDAISEDEVDFIHLNTKVEKIDITQHGHIINNTFQANNIINTAPWNGLYNTLGKPTHLKQDFENIKCNKIVISLYESDSVPNYHWRYIPDINKKHHREFYINNFARDSKCNGVYTETNVIRKDLPNTFNGTLIHEEVTDDAYPIPVIGSTKSITNILDYYKQYNIFGVGRWGQHQYQNADVSMYEAFKFVDSL